MCHIILLLPLLTLPIFWLMPVQLAVPLYGLIVAFSGLTYWLLTRLMKKPVATGAQALVGATADVVSRVGPVKRDNFLVRAEGELWTAHGTPSITPGDKVTITAVDGIKLTIAAAVKR